jgi:YVTN family beta-propeller protein
VSLVNTTQTSWLSVSTECVCLTLWLVATSTLGSASVVFGGSPIAVTADDRTICAVNQDSGSVSIWEWATDLEPIEIPVGEEPRMLAISPDGRRVYVSTQRSQQLAVVDLELKTCIARIPIGGQPVGVAVAKDGRHAFVTQYAGDYLQGLYRGGVVAMVDLNRHVVVQQIPVKARPFAITSSPDGKRLYVTHYFQIGGQGWVSEIEVDTFRLLREFVFREHPAIDSGKGGVFNALAGIAVRPDGRRLVVAGMHANVHRGASQSGRPLSHKTTVQAAVRIVDLDDGVELESAGIVSSFSGQAVAVPTAVVFLPDGQHFLDIYFASQDMKVLAYNESGVVAERALFALPDGPTGVAITRDGKNAFVNCRWSRSIAHISLENLRKPRLLRNQSTASEPWEAQRLLGARVFHDTRNGRMTPNRWLSCGVCHLDGGSLSDNLLWEFTEQQKPGSPRLVNTKSLAVTSWSGPPYLIQGTYQTIHEEEKFIRSFLGGSGFLQFEEITNHQFPDDPNGISPELDALSRYVLALKPRPNPHMIDNRPRPEIEASARRGADLFRSKRVGCFRCHEGRYLTRSGLNSRVRLADVGTGIRADVPSLVNLWETPPYLHDGRAATLPDVVTRFNQHDEHGRTSHLTTNQIRDLVNFLLAPHEEPD